MNREFATRWVEALRGGEYLQCQNVLHGGQGYCCLGVAEIVAGNEFEEDDGIFVLKHDRRKTVSLSDATMRATGMRSAFGRIFDSSGVITVGGGDYTSLADANDDGRTFAQIADAIEQNWERL